MRPLLLYAGLYAHCIGDRIVGLSRGMWTAWDQIPHTGLFSREKGECAEPGGLETSPGHSPGD